MRSAPVSEDVGAAIASFFRGGAGPRPPLIDGARCVDLRFRCAEGLRFEPKGAGAILPSACSRSQSRGTVRLAHVRRAESS